MARCDQCQRDVPQRFQITVYDEKEDLSAYSVIDEIYAWYTGEVTLHVCIRCFTWLTGSQRTESQPAKILFTLRTLQSGIATAIARSLFEYYSYEVRHSGYEYSTPEWVNSLKSGDPNPAAARIRAMPDLRVYDRELNNLYDVEVKTTKQPSSRWRYRKDQIDTISYYHPEAILMVYVQPEHDFYTQRIRRINWGDTTMYTFDSQVFYEVNLQCVFIKPTELFEQMTLDDYYPFLDGAKQILREFM
jgi:hypothetical protein